MLRAQKNRDIDLLLKGGTLIFRPGCGCIQNPHQSPKRNIYFIGSVFLPSVQYSSQPLVGKSGSLEVHQLVSEVEDDLDFFKGILIVEFYRLPGKGVNSVARELIGKDGRMEGRKDGRKDGWTDGGMEGRKDGRTDEWTD